MEKKIYELIEKEMINMRIQRESLVEYIVNYLLNKQDASLDKITNFLRRQMQ